MYLLKMFRRKSFQFSLVGSSLIFLIGCTRSTQSRQDPSLRDAFSSEGKSTSAPGAKKAPAPIPIIDSHIHITPHSEILNYVLRIFSQTGVEKFAVKSAGIPGEERY